MADEIELVARMLAFEEGHAVPCASHLGVALRPDALVICPLSMAGEDTTIHIVACGGVVGPPAIRSVPDPRRRDDQYGLLHWLGAVIERDFLRCRRERTYPQIVVPSAAAVSLLDVVADRLRYTRHDERVRRFGELLSYATERYPYDGQQALLVATGALKLHWATGQDAGEDEHLLANLTWIDPPEGIDTLEAVALAERVPMGAKTDPEFDADVLDPLVSRYNEARRAGASAKELRKRGRMIRDVLEPVVVPIYEATQRAIAVLEGMGLPPLPDLTELERREAEAFEGFMRSRDAGHHLPLRDSPKSAAHRLSAREDAAQNYEAAVLTGDRVARAEGRLSGQILYGEVSNPRKARIAPYRFEYLFEMRSDQRVLRVRLRDELRWVEDPRLRVIVTNIEREGCSTHVSLRIVNGQRAVGLPVEGAALELVPTVPNWNWLIRLRGHLRDRLASTPWTHTDGAPPAYDARLAPEDPLAAVEALR